MSDFKFACPTCGQHIAGDERWAGAQIKCPSCQADMIVPPLETAPAAPPPPVRLSVAPPAPAAPSGTATPTAPAPPPAAPSPVRLSLAPAPAAHAAPAVRTAPPPQAAAPPPASGPPRPAAAGPGPKPYVPSYLKPEQEQKQSKARAILTVAIVVVVLGVAVAFIAPMINSAQKSLNDQRKKDSEDFGGGEVGHVMELNQVLDATDPARFERGAGEKRPKLKDPTYSLDVAAAAIPSGEVRGKISNQGFLLNDAYLEVNGNLYVLYLVHGVNLLPEPIVLISLRLNQGESIQGKSWTIAKETTAGVPSVAKRWITGATGPPKHVPFTGGYAMKLEFEKADSGIIAGKIYLALPDPEQSVIAGEFHADIRVAPPAGAKPGRQRMPAFGDD